MKLIGLTTFVALLGGCKGSTEAPAPAPTPAPSPSPGNAGPANSEPLKAGGEDLAEKMRHCPVTLPGVMTEVEDVDGGIRFALHVAAPDTLAEARRRAHALAEFTAGRSKAKHGGGKGGGFMRNCPILTKDAKVVAENVDGGVRITVTPNDATKVAEFRATARERFDRAPLERASVVREEKSDKGETRLFSGGAADLDGDGMLELVAGGFSATDKGRRPTIIVYRQSGDTWSPLAEAGWDEGEGSTVRNIELADVDGDGKPEIIALGKIGATSHEAKARVTVLALEAGKLVKRAEADWIDGQYTHGYGLAVGDLDGDKKLEIVTGGLQFDGKVETGYVRVWSLDKGTLVVRAKTVLDGQGSPSMRVNDIAIGDLDGDDKPELLVVGRHGPLKTKESKESLDQRREVGDLTVLSFAGDKLTARTRYSWAKGSSLRVRSVVVADLDGDERNEIVVGGQYDAEGRAALAVFGFDKGALVLRDDASSTVAGVTGEVKDLVVAGTGKDVRVLTTGVMGDKPGRHGDVTAWRLEGGKLVADTKVVSRNGDETRARAVVVVPGKAGSSVLTIGHAKNQATMVGQVLEWKLAGR
ncbi:MAG: VCBS repeat-containing protein [Deltaproteobacteria bacterium]|nr:VCBS repeat-containing protein [Deltaproteobacteria bacterium]